MRRAVYICLCLTSILLFSPSACSDSDDSDVPTQAPAGAGDDGGESPVGPLLLEQPEPAQGVAVEVTEPVGNAVDVFIQGAAFKNNNVVVPLGEAVVIKVTNGDPQTHNLRIAGLDGEFDTEDDAVTDPPSIASGEAGELTFAPPVTGAYTFRCDFHPDTMGGRVTVE